MASCMECIHFNPCNSNKSIVVKKQTEGNEWELHNNVEGECKYFTPIADVVPKSEVDNLKVLLEMKEKAYEGLKELYDTDTEALVKAREKTEVEVAREIFEDIDKKIGIGHDVIDIFNILAELKKKYTEGKE